jgi:hypothetical protein
MRDPSKQLFPCLPLPAFAQALCHLEIQSPRIRQKANEQMLVLPVLCPQEIGANAVLNLSQREIFSALVAGCHQGHRPGMLYPQSSLFRL